MGMLAAMYCNCGIECNEAVNKIKKMQMNKSQIRTPEAFLWVIKL